MVSVTGMTDNKMLEIDKVPIVDANVVGNNLFLTKNNGETIDAGNIKGPVGSGGLNADKYFARSTSTQSVPVSTWTDVTGFSFQSGVTGLFTIGSGTTFTVNTAGTYYIKFSLYFGNSSSRTRRIASIWKNGAESRRFDTASASSNSLIGLSHILPLVVGDVLTFRAYQSAAAAVLLVSSGHNVSMVKVL